MARSLNVAMLIGNLGQDPEIRTTGAGRKVANFSMATSRRWEGQNGEAQEKTEWHRCAVWGALADVVESYVKKGDRLYVSGQIEYGSYDDREGITRYTTTINVRELLMLGGPQSHQTDHGAPAAPAAPERTEREPGDELPPPRPAPSRAPARTTSGRAPSRGGRR